MIHTRNVIVLIALAFIGYSDYLLCMPTRNIDASVIYQSLTKTQTSTQIPLHGAEKPSTKVKDFVKKNKVLLGGVGFFVILAAIIGRILFTRSYPNGSTKNG